MGLTDAAPTPHFSLFLGPTPWFLHLHIVTEINQLASLSLSLSNRFCLSLSLSLFLSLSLPAHTLSVSLYVSLSLYKPEMTIIPSITHTATNGRSVIPLKLLCPSHPLVELTKIPVAVEFKPVEKVCPNM